MIDYYVEMVHHCPAEIIRYVETSDLTRPGLLAYWPDLRTTPDSLSAECRRAVLGFNAQRIGAQTSLTNVDQFFRELRAIKIMFGKENAINAELSDTIENMCIRLVQRPDASDFFYIYSHLYSLGINISDTIRTRYSILPSAAEFAQNFKVQDLLFYLAAFGDTQAYEHVREGMRLLLNPEQVTHLLRTIEKWQLPGREAIFDDFKDDTRREVHTSGLAGDLVGNAARKLLGLPPLTVAGTPTNARGRPVTPRSILDVVRTGRM